MTMNLRSERGAVLVAGMVILALLTLLGAGSLLNATLDTQLTANQAVSQEAFYAAEAGLDTGAGTLFGFVNANLRAPNPAAVPGWGGWVTPSSPIDGTDFNGYHVEYRISYQGTLTAGGQPQPYPFSTPEGGSQQLNHQAYTYLLEGRATSLSGAGGAEQMSETFQVLETPLVQYYVFFNDDLGWHPGPEMVSWGRIHTNGDLGFANQDAAGVTFRNYDDANNETPCSITVAGEIRYQGWLQQNGSWSSRSTTPIFVRVNNLTTIPSASGAATTTNPDYVQIDTSINGSNQAAQELRFRDADDRYHVRVGVDRMPTASFQSLVRGGFYETEALNPMREDVDGLVILSDPTWRIVFHPFDGPSADVTNLVASYQVAAGVSAAIDTWPQGARTNASHTGAAPSLASTAAPPIARTMIYSPENIVQADELGGTPNAARGANANRFYPCVLERQDRRETQEVDLTVIDLQRLQYWYRDYLDYRDGGGLDGSINATLADRSLLIYVSRSISGGGFVGGSGVGALQAVKIIGSAAGRTRRADDMQASPTLLVRTTLATDNPLYLEGDFNSPNHNGGSTVPGGVGCALLSDALTLLSNNWGPSLYVAPGTPPNTGGYNPPNRPTASAAGTVYNAAFFTGRYNFRAFPTGDEEAGIHNFPHFAETWNPGSPAYQCIINGCLINLWFSQQSLGSHGGTYYGAPTRRFGWDRQFANPNYWPPYVPSIYSVERTAWRED
jgi:hypothetical protein